MRSSRIRITDNYRGCVKKIDTPSFGLAAMGTDGRHGNGLILEKAIGVPSIGRYRRAHCPSLKEYYENKKCRMPKGAYGGVSGW